jgi:hypothetical protein
MAYSSTAAGCFTRRLATWRAPEPPYTAGVLAKYCALVPSASEGAVTPKVSATLQELCGPVTARVQRISMQSP